MHFSLETISLVQLVVKNLLGYYFPLSLARVCVLHTSGYTVIAELSRARLLQVAHVPGCPPMLCLPSAFLLCHLCYTPASGCPQKYEKSRSCWKTVFAKSLLLGYPRVSYANLPAAQDKK